MKVLIVSPCVNLPVPAVRGGAVSTLIEYLIMENEIEEKMELTVLSIYDPDAEKTSKKYLKTKIEFIRPSEVTEPVDRVVDFIFSVGKSDCEKHQYFRKYNSLHYISKYLNKYDFDKVVFENSGFLLNVLKDMTIAEKYRDKLYYHLHNDIPDNIYVPGVRKCTFLLVSEYLKKHINEVCGQDMTAQCKIVRNGFACEYFTQKMSEEQRTALRESLKIARNKKIVLFAGRIVPSKGIAELTEAIKMLTRDDVVLMVVGAHNFGMDQTSDFQKKMEQKFCVLGDKVCFTGFVPYRDIWKYYKLANVAVLPSMWEEPAGLTMMEACAAGVPLITTKSGGIPEYINEDYSMLLNRSDDIVNDIVSAIETILNNEQEWKTKAICAMKNTIKRYNTKMYYDLFVKNIDCQP